MDRLSGDMEELCNAVNLVAQQNDEINCMLKELLDRTPPAKPPPPSLPGGLMNQKAPQELLDSTPPAKPPPPSPPGGLMNQKAPPIVPPFKAPPKQPPPVFQNDMPKEPSPKVPSASCPPKRLPYTQEYIERYTADASPVDKVPAARMEKPAFSAVNSDGPMRMDPPKPAARFLEPESPPGEMTTLGAV